MKYYLGFNSECNIAFNFGIIYLGQQEDTILISEEDAQYIFKKLNVKNFEQYDNMIEDIMENNNFSLYIWEILLKNDKDGAFKKLYEEI